MTLLDWYRVRSADQFCSIVKSGPQCGAYTFNRAESRTILQGIEDFAEKPQPFGRALNG